MNTVQDTIRAQSEVERPSLTGIQSLAMLETIDHVADIARSWSNLQSEELTYENIHFLANLCLANREYVLAHQKSDAEKEPTREERELAFLGDVLVTTHGLAKSGFFTKENQANDLVSMMTESHFNPRAVKRVVNNPSQYISTDISNVSPEMLTNLLYVWGEVSSNWVYEMQPPSISNIYQAMKQCGADLERVVSDDDIDVAFESLRPTSITVTPQMISDPYRERRNTEKYAILVPELYRENGDIMSFEYDDVDMLRWTIGNLVNKAYFEILSGVEFSDKDNITTADEIPYDISDPIAHDRLNPLDR